MAKAFVKAMVKGPFEYTSKKTGVVYSSVLLFANDGNPCDIKADVDPSTENGKKLWQFCNSHPGAMVNAELDIKEGFEKDEIRFSLLGMTPLEAKK